MAYPYDSTVSEAIKRAGLPKDHDIHWSAQRKADVVHAVRDKLISFDEARGRYLLSRSEFRGWEEQVDRKAARSAARSAARQASVRDSRRTSCGASAATAEPEPA